jgi:hypothetical protein
MSKESTTYVDVDLVFLLLIGSYKHLPFVVWLDSCALKPFESVVRDE